jgi:hypothetical protein
MYLKFKAIIETKRPVVEKKSNKLQEIIVRVPARTNEFGDKIGEDDHFQVTAWKDEKIEKLKPFNAGAKVEVAVFMNGREFTTTAGDPGYGINMNLHEITGA